MSRSLLLRYGIASCTNKFSLGKIFNRNPLSDQDSFEVTVEDNIKPTITAPGTLTVGADLGACSKVIGSISLGAAVTSDNCSIVSVTNDAPASFPIGNTMVTWTVKDASGNTQTASIPIRY